MDKKWDELSPEQQLELQTVWIGVCVALVRNDVAKGKGNTKHAAYYRDEAVRTWDEARDALKTNHSSSGVVIHI